MFAPSILAASYSSASTAGRAANYRTALNPVVFHIFNPENIGNKVTHPEGEKINFLKGQVSVVEHMGHEEFIYFTIDGCEFTSRIEARKTDNVKYGEEGEFYFNIKRDHIFDAETEENRKYHFIGER